MEAIQTIPILSPEALWKMDALRGLKYEEIRPMARKMERTKDASEDPLVVHQRILALVKDAVDSPEWKGPRENIGEEFIRWRNRYDVFGE